MIREVCQRVSRVARNFLRQQRGSILIYTGAFVTIGVGGAALSIDIGRIVLLRTQMQNAADASALAGAAQLDGKIDAITRASQVMQYSMTAFTTSLADQGTLTKAVPLFYTKAATLAEQQKNIRGPQTTTGTLARFAAQDMGVRTLSFFYAPAVNMMTGQSASNIAQLGAWAVAMSDPFICKVQPLMICDPFDDGLGGYTADLMDPSFAGRSISIKQGIQGGGTWTAGNFGLLQLPTDAAYNVGGANAIAAALSAEEPQGCYSLSVLTQPGSMTVKVEDAINTRFGLPITDSSIKPAPNVINYAKDATYQIAGVLGNGDWPLASYWATVHAADPPLPTSPKMTDATRWQIYLYELGVTFYKAKSGKKTATYLDPAELAGGGWDTVVPPSIYGKANLIPKNASFPNDNWKDGVPPANQTVSSIDFRRRTIRVALMACKTQGVKGNGSYSSSARYLEIFMTEQSPDPSAGGGIYGEIVGAVNQRTSVEFHGNVRLTE